MAEALGEADLRIRHFPPRFADPKVEAEFRRDFFQRSRGMARLALLVGCAIYAAFGLLDLWIVDEGQTAVLAIRFGVICPFLLLVAYLTRTELFRQYSQPILSVAMMVGGLGIIAMTAVTEPPVSAWYYAGLSLVIIYCTSAIRLLFVNAFAVTLLLVACYVASAFWISPIPAKMLVSNVAFLVGTVGVGVFANYTLELFVREKYANGEQLRAAMREANYLKSQADAANRAKSEFLATMSHELRTPLNAVIGFAEVIHMQLLGRIENSKYSDYAEDILKSARHLLAILSDILDLSKAETGALTLNEDVVDVGELIDEVMALMRQDAAEHGVRLAARRPEDAFSLNADPRLTRQMLINLVSNAIKFSGDGGIVTVATGLTRAGGFELQVIDKGIGIDAEDLDRIFEPFTQVGSAFARDHGGSGLGLPLVKKIVTLHGGTIDIQSQLGAGTTVTIRFPAERVFGQGARIAPPRRAMG